MIRVTDHALVRFLERSGALDIEQLRGILAAGLDRATRSAERAGISDFVIVADGLRYVVEAGALVTVMEDGEHPTRRRPGALR